MLDNLLKYSMMASVIFAFMFTMIYILASILPTSKELEPAARVLLGL